MVVLDGQIYMVGGATEWWEPAMSVVEAYDLAEGVWKPKADLPTPRIRLTAGVVRGRIYAIGGQDKGNAAGAIPTVEEYDPDRAAWETKANMPTGRIGAAAVVVDEKIYVIGGWSNARIGEWTEVYDPQRDSWTIQAGMRRMRAYLTATVLDGVIYAIGGADPEVSLTTVETFDTGVRSRPVSPSGKAVSVWGSLKHP